MPHCTLEYSANIKEKPDARSLFSRLHPIIAESGVIKLEDLKSRLIRHDEFYMGDGTPQNAFVALVIAMLDGRTLEARQAIGEKVINFLEHEFAASIKDLRCSITVEIREINRSTFYKKKRS